MSVLPYPREHPIFFMFIQIAIISIFKSYPTVGDVALYMAFFPVWNHLYRCEYSSLIPWWQVCVSLSSDEAARAFDGHLLCQQYQERSSDIRHSNCLLGAID